ncbi:DUF2087 domain-containing protein [Telmatospirillum siberiense]|uniref:DUF2087 domain-containing protein n=1 Tax=Telmatospirillum siberiense TaxID=382514 RepID=A0A2N3PXU3_9PROT|nr:DUF2087 domain-containing protein [Telmatospirillum siberiense]PKU25209.1 hypothetical protein CWS72_07715 [Telmatospirillum siberiense]
MSRSLYPFHAQDISVLARSLVKQWSDQAKAPGHVQMLNMLVRASGYRNFQHFRTQVDAGPIPPMAAKPETAPDEGALTSDVKRLLRYFDSEGHLIRWPGKYSCRLPCLWVIWAGIPARRVLNERQVNQVIQAGERVGDHVLLRRELVDHGLLIRTPDGSQYRRVEQMPPAEVRHLLHLMFQRRRRRPDGAIKSP